MKECWINVYCDEWNNTVWYGHCHPRRLEFVNKENENGLLYRIHVVLK